MKSSTNAKSTFLLPIRLKTEKFIKEQLWQLLLVVAFVALCAWILEKPIEAICFCTAHIVIRANFDKQYHSSVTRICLFITSLVVFCGGYQRERHGTGSVRQGYAGSRKGSSSSGSG